MLPEAGANRRVGNKANTQANATPQSKPKTPVKENVQSTTTAQAGPNPQASLGSQVETEAKDDACVEAEASPTLHLLSLPLEVRRLIFELTLPRNANLVIDPLYRNTTLTKYVHSYESTASLVRVSKQTYAEVIPLIYSRNTLTVTSPYNWPSTSVNLSSGVLSNVRKIEVSISQTLAELGGLWSEMHKLPYLREIKLSCRRSPMWTSFGGELAWRSWNTGAFQLKLELHQDYLTHYHGFNVSHGIIGRMLRFGGMHASFYSVSIPENIEIITVSASTDLASVGAFVTYSDDHETDWRFRRDGGKDTATCKHLVWGKDPNAAMEDGEQPLLVDQSVR